MDLDDPLGLVDRERLAAVSRAVGLPPPTVARLVGRARAGARYLLEFRVGVPPRALLVELIPPPAGTGVVNALTALRRLSFVDAVPSPTTFRVLPSRLLGRHAALSPHRERTTGRRLIERNSDHGPRIAGDVGRLVAALEEVELPGWGLRSDGAAFSPMRGSWAEDWVARARALHLAASLAGTDLGPLSERVLAAVLARATALEGVEGFSLVHADLSPGVLHYRGLRGGPELVEVTGWAGAMAADPLVEWGGLLSLPPETLGHVLQGYGPRAPELLAPEQLARIEAYHLTDCLAQLRWVGAEVLYLGALEAVARLEQIHLRCERALEEGHVEDRLRRALELGSSAAPAPGDGPSPGRARLRRSLGLLRADPPLLNEEGSVLVAALGAHLLATRLDGIDATRARAAEGVADELLAAHRREGWCTWRDPVGDREAWLASLVGEVQVAAGLPGACRSLLALWLGLEAFSELGWAVSDATLRSWECLIRSLVAQEHRQPGGEPAARATCALLGLAAAQRLGHLLPSVDPSAVGEVLRARLDEAWASLDRHESPVEPTDQQLLSELDRQGDPPLRRNLTPVVLLALRVLRCPLPAPPTTLLEVARL